MKLIRCSTDRPDAFFDNEFQSNIDVPVGSKIALLNLSLDGAEQALTINDNNNQIQIGYSGSTISTAVIENGDYTQSQITDLTDKITDACNKTVSSLGTEMGCQWLIEKDRLDKITFEKRQGKLTEYASDFKLTNVARTGDGVYSSTGLSTETNNNVMVNKLPLSKGSFVFRCKIHTLIPTEHNKGFTFGVSPLELNGSDLTPPIPIEKMLAGIQVTGSGNKYNTIKEGVLTTSPIDTDFFGIGNANNDVIEISLDQNRIFYSVYKLGTELTLAQQFDLPTNTIGVDLFPVIIFNGDSDEAAITKVAFTADPFKTSSLGLNTDFSLERVPTQSSAPTNQFIQFQGITLANYLGFNNIRVPVSGTILSTANIKYIADNVFIIKRISDSILVEMLNINLLSYDSISKNRRNIIAVIPAQPDLINGRVVYEANNLIFLDIDNINATQFRNIKARVLNEDLSPVSTQGQSVMTLLLKNKDE